MQRPLVLRIEQEETQQPALELVRHLAEVRPHTAAGRQLDAHALAEARVQMAERLERQELPDRRVEILRVEGDLAILARGPAPGTAVVVVGVAELFGTEFGTGK